MMIRLLATLFTLTITWASFAAERNIVFIITDDQSQTAGCYGDEVAVTPALDTLAADGIVFRRAYATTASCSASRSVVMSGLHNHFNGQYGHTHSWHKFESFRNVVSLSLPRALSSAGYRTAQIGKYHVAPEEAFRFDTYLKANSRDPVAMAEACREFIATTEGQPFFLYFGTSDPHRHGTDLEGHPGKYKPNSFGNLPGGQSRPGIEAVVFEPDEVVVPPFLPDTPETRAELAQYYQSCNRIDQGLARLVEVLKENNLYDKTLIVFTSDHGMAFPGAKTTIYEGGLLVPFVVRDPYQEKRGTHSDSFISHVDITPSLLDFAGALDRARNRPESFAPPGEFWDGKPHVEGENLGSHDFDRYHGTSWMPILSDPGHTLREQVYGSHTFHEIQMYYPMRSVFDGHYKLIWNIAHGLPYPFASDLWRSSTWQAQLEKGPDAPYGLGTVDSYVNRPEFELFDLSESKFEGRNLADDPRYAHVLADLKAKLRAFQEETDDPWILKWTYE